MPDDAGPQSSIILYQTDDGQMRIQCRFEDDTLWLTQALIAELFQTTPQNVTLHLKAIYEEGELLEAATCKDYLQVRTEGLRQVTRSLRHYSLPAILAVGYRVRSPRGTQFRQWATARLTEFLVKGFTMDDDRLKNLPGPGVPDYFDELLERIRDMVKPSVNGAANNAGGLSVDAAFPGGNIVLEAVDGDTVRLHQDLRDTKGDWFYWCFRLRGAAGRTLRFAFTRSPAIGIRGPAVSYDQGRTWAWLGQASVEGNGFVCSFPSDVDDVRFSVGMPYLQNRWDGFVGRYVGSPLLVTGTLCTTPKGRRVEYARAGHLEDGTRHRVLVTSRHHCCEMMATYALEGLLEFVLADAGEQAGWLRQNVEFLAIPFVDKDGVEDGDQGKNRMPRDHARDYAGESLYASTLAIREFVPKWAAGRLGVTMDLHCPWLRGPYHEVVHVVGSSDSQMAARQQVFSQILERQSPQSLPVVAGDFLPFGTAWNTVANWSAGQSIAGWAMQEVPELHLGLPMEIPYANAGGVEVNQTSAKAFGVDLARGLSTWLKDLS